VVAHTKFFGASDRPNRIGWGINYEGGPMELIHEKPWLARDLTNAQFPMLNSHPKGLRYWNWLPIRIRIEHWELSIGQIRARRRILRLI